MRSPSSLLCRREQFCVDQDAVALHPEQHFPHRHFDRAVNVVELGVSRQRRVQHLVQAQRDIGVLRRVIGGAFDRHLLEGDAVCALAGDLIVGDGPHVQVSRRQVVQVVRPVRLDDIRFQQRVVRDSGECKALVGEHMLVVLDVLAELLPLWIRKPRREPPQHARAIELVRHTGVAMSEGDVAGASGFGRERDAHDAPLHRIQIRGLGVDRDQRRSIDSLEPAFERRLVEHGFIVRCDKRSAPSAPASSRRSDARQSPARLCRRWCRRRRPPQRHPAANRRPLCHAARS